jgi:antitoxin (DNA-binding transcriptional repressor) of toxin-antitoxin stability system
MSTPGDLSAGRGGMTARAARPVCSAGDRDGRPSAPFRTHPQEERHAMDTVKIRELRGTDLQERARSGRPLALTNRGSLIAVIVPVTRAWVQHLVDYNWSHVRQSIDEGERAMAAGEPMATIDDVMALPGPGDGHARQAPELLVPVVAAVIGGTVMQPPETRETLERLHAALNPRGPDEAAAGPSVLTVRIGELSAERIERAGAAGQTLALTHDRELVAIVIPVTQGLVEFLIEQNMSRVLYNTALGEKEILSSKKMVTLEDALDSAPPRPA